MNAVLKPSMHPDEWKERVQLAACYRVFAMLGWTEMIYNHITTDRKFNHMRPSIAP